MKTLHYYCENCGAEVRRDAKVCPHCGRFFSSVKCPRCGYAGRPEDFKAGCPVCGYSEPIGPSPEPFGAPPSSVSPLPLWVYLSAGAALALILVLLFMVLK